MLNKNRVLVAMSGGVDSSVAITKLNEMGYETIGITLKLWETIDPVTKLRKNSHCNSTEAINGAKMICDRLGVHHYTIDEIDSFKKYVVDDFTDEYLKGRTPNPCVKCNSYVKWGKLIEQANKFDAYYIATGHYARIDHKELSIKKGVDTNKDQSYMLWHISKEHIERTLLPIGELKKDEVRKYATEKALETSDIPDSQDLCFVMDGDYRNFLNKFMPEKMENIDGGDIKSEDGNVIGKHTGFTNYTIGQRRGLGLSKPEPRYVKKINPISNTITVAKKDSMFSNVCTASQINWLLKPQSFPFKATTKIRYNSIGTSALINEHEGSYTIHFDEPQLAITPGQSIVFYDDDTLLGGGIINGNHE